MKKSLLAGVLLAFLAVAAEAQVYIEYNRQNRHGALRIVYRGGYGWGYGYGFPGRYGTFSFNPYGYRLGYADVGGWYGGSAYSWYEGPAYLYWAPYTVLDHPWPPRRAAVADEDRSTSPAFMVALGIEEGRRRFRRADYRGAVEAFREAVTADFDAAAPKAWFALALVVTGDLRNADKSLRAAADRAPFGEIDLRGMFLDERERARVLRILARAAEGGSLAAAWALFLDGQPEALKGLAEKDPAARRLLEPSTGGARRPS